MRGDILLLIIKSFYLYVHFTGVIVKKFFDEFKRFEMRAFYGIELYHSTLKNNELSL